MSDKNSQGQRDVPAKRGPRADRTDVAAAILDAAREVFSAQGYQAASMRAIARRADVDAKLIHYYYGTKADLFASIAERAFVDEGLQGRLVDGFASGGGLHAYVEQVVTTLDDPTMGPAFLSLLRSVGTHEESRELLLFFIRNQIHTILFPGQSLEEASLEVHAIGAQVMGMMVLRYILCLPGLVKATPAQIADTLAPALDVYLERIRATGSLVKPGGSANPGDTRGEH